MHKRKRQRRRMTPGARRAGIVGVLVGAVLVGFGAIATWHAVAPFQGSVNSEEFAVSLEWRGTGDHRFDVDGMEFEAPSQSRPVTFGVDNAYPGSSVVLHVRAKLEAGGEEGRVTGVSLPGLPAGWTAEVASGCGSLIRESSSYTEVDVRISMTE